MSSSTPTFSQYKITLSYDGRNYLGWQRHGDKPTLQRALEQALEQLFGIRVTIRGSGRTDRGAHAHGQVASAELPSLLQPEQIVTQINTILEDDIRVLSVEVAPADFHACDSAVAKQYRYIIWNDRTVPADRDGRVWHVKTPLDFEAMVDACEVFTGEHDFASFATKPNFKQKSTTRTVHRAEIQQQQSLIIFDIWADGFLYKMVRNIVRAIVKAGEGRYSTKDLRRILAAKDRKAAPGTAPASGLYLEQVFYSDQELAENLAEKSKK